MLVRNDCRTDYRVLKEASSLAKAGYLVRVVALNLYGPLEREDKECFEIVRVAAEPSKHKLMRGVNLIPRAIIRMAAIAAAWRADIYHAHDSDSILPAWLATRCVPNARLVYDAHEVGFISLQESLTYFPPALAVPNWLWSQLNDWIVRRHVSAMLSVNAELAEFQARHYGHIRPTVVMNCPPRINIDIAMGDWLARSLGLDADLPIVMCHGMFSLERGDGPGLENLIRLAGALEQVAVVLLGNVGDAQPFAALRQLAREPRFSGRVFILPRVPPQEVIHYTAGARLGVLPLQLRGLARYAAPNKLFDYITAYRPVIVGDMPPAQRLCAEYGCGLTYDPASLDSLIQAVTWLLDDTSAYSAMSAGAARAAQVYNWETQAQTLVNLYSSLLDQTGTRL